MALLPIHKYFCFNGEMEPVDEFIPSENEGGIYEVLRVVNGIPLFLEDHMERFHRSANIAGKTIPFSVGEIQEMLHRLINKNQVGEGNILISCKTNLKAFFIPHKYPEEQQYRQGVLCGVLRAERENPNAKVFQTSVRQQANKLIEENDFYEVLLVDHEERITEGSRSNVFFIKGNEIITPLAQQVLLGITRQKALECARKLGLIVTECDVYVNDLVGFEAVFITGTSPKLLPVKEVAGFQFSSSNTILRSLMFCFDKMIADYIKTPGIF